MKAFLIEANTKKIGQVSVDDGLAGVKRLIRFDTVDSDEIDANGDLLFFDEDRRSNATFASIPDPDSSRHSGAVFRRSLKNAPESERKYCPWPTASADEAALVPMPRAVPPDERYRIVV